MRSSNSMSRVLGGDLARDVQEEAVGELHDVRLVDGRDLAAAVAGARSRRRTGRCGACPSREIGLIEMPESRRIDAWPCAAEPVEQLVRLLACPPRTRCPRRGPRCSRARRSGRRPRSASGRPGSSCTGAPGRRGRAPCAAPTLTERKPPPTGVVIGPLSAVPLLPDRVEHVAPAAGCRRSAPSRRCRPAGRPTRTRRRSPRARAASPRRARGRCRRRGSGSRDAPYGGGLYAGGSGAPVRYRPANQITTRRPMNDFKPGLEGVVAFETEIAEPDREGGSLRYRGVDIEELVGDYRFEQVWGLLVDERFEPGLPAAEPYEGGGLTGNTPADLQAVTARCRRRVGAPEADRHLRRRGARGPAAALGAVHLGRRAVRPDRRRRDATGSRRRRSRRASRRPSGSCSSGAARPIPKHVQALDTYWICTAEHGLNASTFTARIVASTGADCARGALLGRRRPLRAAARRRAGPRAADARRGGRRRATPSSTSTTCSTAASG